MQQVRTNLMDKSRFDMNTFLIVGGGWLSFTALMYATLGAIALITMVMIVLFAVTYEINDYYDISENVINRYF